MALTRPGKVLFTILTIAIVVGGVFIYSAVTGNKVLGVGTGPTTSPGVIANAPCPLTGLKGDVPDRPALAVKIENAPAARPQAGLEKADIVYEEPAEGGITRYIAIFQCQDADRLGPIRSVRLVDPDVVRQYRPGKPLFAYSGGIPDIKQTVTASGLLDIGFETSGFASAYHRDINRPQPHNLYSSTGDLYGIADHPKGSPDAMFNYDDTKIPVGKAATSLNIQYATDTATDTNVFWKWNGGKKAWFRLHGTTPHKVESGAQISAKNVIVQMVQTRDSGFRDVNGQPVLEIGSLGEGDAIVFRNGEAIVGRWVRHQLQDRTVFEDSRGREIDMSTGNTWIELVPTDITVKYS